MTRTRSSEQAPGPSAAEYAALVRLAQAIAGNDAEDAVQDALAAEVSVEPKPDNPSAWRRAVVRNRAISLARKPRGQTLPTNAVAGDPPASEALDRQRCAQLLSSALAAVDEPFQVALRLRFYEGLTYREIGERLRCSPNTAAWRVREGLARVRTGLDERPGGRARWYAAFAPAALSTRSTASRVSGASGATAFKGAAAAALLATLGAGVTAASACQDSTPNDLGLTASSSVEVGETSEPAPHPAGPAVPPRPIDEAGGSPDEFDIEILFGAPRLPGQRAAIVDTELLRVPLADAYRSCATSHPELTARTFAWAATARVRLGGERVGIGEPQVELASRVATTQGAGSGSLLECLSRTAFPIGPGDDDAVMEIPVEVTHTPRRMPDAPIEWGPGVFALADSALPPARGGLSDGDPDAPTLLTCARLDDSINHNFHAVVERVLDENPRLRHVGLYFPSTTRNEGALKAAAVLAAAHFGKYWEAVDAGLADETQWSESDVSALATRLQIQPARLLARATSAQTQQQLNTYAAACEDGSVPLPRVFIDGRELKAHRYSTLGRAIPTLLRTL